MGRSPTVLLAALTALLGACQPPAPPAAPESRAMNYAERASAAHGLAEWWKTQAVEADIALTFGTNPPLLGTMRFETNGPRARFDLPGGAKVHHDGKDAWLSPAAAEFQGARFHVQTWPWFFAAPFKITGAGTKLMPWGRVQYGAESFLMARQTFAADQGDAPDDWYDLHLDPATHELVGMGYIVTYSKARAEAEKSTSGIRYREFATVEGMRLPVRWEFVQYTVGGGFGETKGTAVVSNIRFLRALPAGYFDPGTDSRPLPR